MIFRTHPPGHRPRSLSFVEFRPLFRRTATGKTVHLPSLRLLRGLVVAAARRMGFRSSRRPAPSFFRSLTAFMRLSMEDASIVAVTKIPTKKKPYQPHVQALEAVSSSPADLRGRTKRRTAPPSSATAHSRHCRGLCPACRDGRTRASGRKCPQAYPVVHALRGLLTCLRNNHERWGISSNPMLNGSGYDFLGVFRPNEWTTLCFTSG